MKLPTALSTAALAGALLLTATHAAASPADDDLVQRRAIRGAPVDTGVRETDELRALRQFDEQSFPRPLLGASDRAADDQNLPDYGARVATGAGVGPDALPDALRSPTPMPPTEPAAPSAIPWLSALRMPDLAVRLDPRVVRYLEFYKNDPKGRSIMSSWLRRQGRYRAMIDAALEQAKLPKALLYVSMIESSYDPHDRSHAGAIGLWQFLPENGRIYGLRIDHYVDERKDPEKATLAVMRYLGDLQARFGGWPLSLAAFNAGYGAVLRSIKKYNTNDYWEMCRHEDGLPWETTLYVPKVMAAAIVGENRALFGYDDLVADPPLLWDRIFVDTSMSVAAIASAAGVSEAQIATLNPQLRRNRTPPGETRFEVHIPRGTTGRFLASYDKAKEPVRPYLVRFGERLDEIAASLQMSTKALKTLNGIEDSAEVRPGLTLVIPAGKTPTVPAYDTIVVAVPDKDAVVSGRKRVFYRTLPNDTIADVAHFFGVKPGDLLHWNNLDTEARLVGSLVLQIWVASEFDGTKAALVDTANVRLVTVGSDEFFDLEETKRGRVRLSYTVRAGDDLKKIGKKFGLTVADMERINRFHEQAKPIVAGQKLIVYRAMTAAEKQKAVAHLTPGGAEAKTHDPAPQDDDANEDPERASGAVGDIEGRTHSGDKTDGKDDDASMPHALPRPPIP